MAPGVKRRLGRLQSARAIVEVVVDGWSVLAGESPRVQAPPPAPPSKPPPGLRLPSEPLRGRRRRAPVQPRIYWVAAALLAGCGDLYLARLLVHRGVSGAALLSALLPAFLLLLGALVESTRVALFYAALCLSIILPVVTSPIHFAGSSIYAADVVALLALASWVAARLLGRDARGPSASAVTGFGFPLLVLAVGQAIVRGHASYGLGLVSEPMRLLLYASIALTITQADSRRLYRGIVAVFYAGTVWMLVSAAYYVARGTSQTDQIDVSTGGHRYVSLTVAMYLAAGLFLALLNLQIEENAKRRALHLTIAVLALAGIALSLGRSTFVAVAVVVPLVLLFLPRVLTGLLGLLPLAVPIVALAFLTAPHLVPGLGSELARRVTASPERDVNAQWRVAAGSAIWRNQVTKSPLFGVGFGRDEPFILVQKVHGVPTPFDDVATQDPHNGYLYLLGGGGGLALGAFALVVLGFLVDVWRRLRSPLEAYERVLVLWSLAALFVFLVNAGTGLVLQNPGAVLTIWALLALPSAIGSSVVRYRPSHA